MKLPSVSMIVAMTPEGVIGNKGTMPWHLPRDMARFRKYTIPSAVVMGPKTYASLPRKHRPLRDRLNIVLTSNRDYKPEPDVLVAHSPSQALELAAIRGWAEFYAIGGAMIYMSFLPYAETLRITYVNSNARGDTYFPHWDKDEWYLVFEEKEWKQEEGDTYPTRFAEWRRKVKSLPEGTPHSWPHPQEHLWRKNKKFAVGGVIARKKAPKKKAPAKSKKKARR